jgi:organic hydroperoxide reductase OsmC/OhrA
MKSLQYEAGVIWEGNLGEGTRSYSAYSRHFRVLVPNRPAIVASADPYFRGDPDKHNPEELLLSAVAGCHMLFYLSLCARNGVNVLEYKDAGTCEMRLHPAGGGEIAEVVLHP